MIGAMKAPLFFKNSTSSGPKRLFTGCGGFAPGFAAFPHLGRVNQVQAVFEIARIFITIGSGLDLRRWSCEECQKRV